MCVALGGISSAREGVDRNRARGLYEKSRRGEALTPEEQAYLDRAIRELKPAADKKADSPAPKPAAAKPGETHAEQPSTGLKPLTEMTADDRYKGEDGGLYGGGRNEPPKAHLEAAHAALRAIAPRDERGTPSPSGKIVFVSLGMSNTAGEFGVFKELADRDPRKSPAVVLVNCAIGGAGVSSWASKGSGTWQKVGERLRAAGVTPEQVQVAWVKHADPGPEPDAVPLQYARHVRDKIAASLEVTRATFPNLRVAYFSSRIYGGYNAAGVRRVNPEPFAYETAFSVRGVIREQVEGKAFPYERSPVLLWGPYLWADGVTPRKDGLTWVRGDFGNDGVHPNRDTGGRKVADQLLTFFTASPTTRPWFVKP